MQNPGVTLGAEGQQLTKTSFGELTTASLTAEVQIYAVYGVTPKTLTVSALGGSAGASGGEFFATSGTNAGGIGSVFSARQLVYKPGQGALARMSARFSPGQANSLQLAGPQTSGDGLSFGFLNEDFGIQWARDGQLEIQSLQITGVAAGAENATVTIDDTPFTVPLTNGTVQFNAMEVAESLASQTSTYVFQQIDDTVVVRAVIAAAAGTFSFSSSTATGTFTQTAAGVGVTIDFFAQADWNRNNLPSLNPLVGNIYQIQFQYLGYGAIDFSIEEPKTGLPLLVHRIEYANTSTEPSLRNPTFRLTWAAVNTGNTTSLTVNGASAAAFLEGGEFITESSRAFKNTKLAVAVNVETNILTLAVREVFGTDSNRARIEPQFVTAAHDGNKQVIVSVLLNAAVAGDTNFQFVDEDNSIALTDTAGTTVTNGRLIGAFVMPPLGSGELDLTKLDSLMVAGDTITLSANKVGGAAADITVTFTWSEDI